MLFDSFSPDLWLIILTFAGGTLRALRNQPAKPGPALVGSLTSTLAVVLGIVGYCDYSEQPVTLWMGCLAFFGGIFGSELMARLETQINAQLKEPTWILKLLPPFLGEFFNSKPNDKP